MSIGCICKLSHISFSNIHFGFFEYTFHDSQRHDATLAETKCSGENKWMKKLNITSHIFFIKNPLDATQPGDVDPPRNFS
jgi:hypothetical protein